MLLFFVMFRGKNYCMQTFGDFWKGKDLGHL